MPYLVSGVCFNFRELQQSVIIKLKPVILSQIEFAFKNMGYTLDILLVDC